MRNTVSNPRAKADRLLAKGYVARVHEPSPPAVEDDDFFADDPLTTEVASDTIVASIGGDMTWIDYVSDHPELAPWAS